MWSTAKAATQDGTETSRDNKSLAKEKERQVKDESALSHILLVLNNNILLQEHEMKGYIAIMKSALNRKNTKARLSWWKRNELKDADDWNKIIFSDKTWMEPAF